MLNMKCRRITGGVPNPGGQGDRNQDNKLGFRKARLNKTLIYL